MGEVLDAIERARQAQLRYDKRNPVQLEIGVPMKRYICVFEVADGDTEVECYWADNHDHAEEQCRDSNPPDITYKGTFRDSSDERRF